MVASPFRELLPEQGVSASSMVRDYVDCGVGLALMLLAVALLRLSLSAVIGWRGVALLLGPAVLLTFLWLMACWGGSVFIAQLLPAAASVEDLNAGRVAVNYLIPLLALLGIVRGGRSGRDRVGRRPLAGVRSPVLRGLDNPIHHIFHQLGRDVHGFVAKPRVLADAAGRGPWEPAVVLLRPSA